MEAKQYLSTIATVFLVTTFFIHCYSRDSAHHQTPVMSGNCVLNFSYPYQPCGECMGTQRKIKQWDSISTTLCCSNALRTLSEALALRLASQPPEGTLFLPQELWSNCSGVFLRQPTVSVASCGFSDSFFYGTTYCSKLKLQDVGQLGSYQSALSACSRFDNFTDDCNNCATAVTALRDDLLAAPQGNRDKSSEGALCGVAAVVSVLSDTVNDSSHTEDYFGCLRLLDQLDPDYIKIKNSWAHLLVAVIVAITAIMLIIVLIKHVTKKKTKEPVKSKEYANNWSALYRFSKEEIFNAINYGNERTSLGRGSAGHVYKGFLPSGQAVAIKHINPNSHPDSFIREVEGLSRIRHPNLVCLFGFCMEDNGNYLVYEFCPGGNLGQQLLRRDTLLTWGKRVRILRDCALALRYLHRFMDGCIVHRDIKLTNILLTETLEPKLSDFGLAKVLNMEESKVFTDVRGTIGYMDPDYMTNAKLTCASDIYSFGIVILQILSGQKVIAFNLDAREQLTRKAKDVSLGNRPPEDFEDPRLKGKVNKADFKSILDIAVLCVAKSGQDRPDIDMVFNEMERAWKNTDDYKRVKNAKQEPTTSSATPMSNSMEGGSSSLTSHGGLAIEDESSRL